jgi:Tfp pilus assembly protein PilO
MMQPQEFSGAIQKNIINIAVIAVCIIVAQRIFVSQMKQVEAIKAETQAAQQKNLILGEIVQSEKKLKNLRRSINLDGKETSVINTLNTIAKNIGVKIVELKPVPEQVTLGYTKYPFVLNVAVDNYHTLGKFMSALESNPFLFTIDNISVNNEAVGESRRYRLHVNLEVSTILIKD